MSLFFMGTSGKRVLFLAYCILYPWGCILLCGHSLKAVILGTVMVSMSVALVYSIFETIYTCYYVERGGNPNSCE